MAAITPDTDVILLKVPLEMDEKNQLTFASATAQYNYFYGLTGKKVYDKFTYQRKDGVLTVPEKIDNLYDYNYVMYRNEGFGTKWFYAFITEMKWLSPNSTDIKIKTDVWQTWQFNITRKPCFVEREHVNDDTIGANTVPEGMDVGEYVLNGTAQIEPDKTVTDIGGGAINNIMFICFQVTELLDELNFAATNSFNRTYSGLRLIAAASAADATNLIKGYDFKGKDSSESAIVSIFMAPKEFFAGAYTQTITYNVTESTTATTKVYTPYTYEYATTLLDTTTITMNSTLDGYSPRNNKLFTYPYNYLYVTNNVGSDAVYHYEDFLSGVPKFYMGGALGQGCSIKLAPVNYKRHGSAQYPTENFTYALTGAKYPVCAWKSDYYTNWLAQNAGNIQAKLISGVVGGLGTGTLYSGGNLGMGVAMAGLNLVQNSIAAYAEDAKAKIMPDQAHGNANCSDVNFAWRRYFTAQKMSVRAEYARIIDDFFSMFGYKINRVKIPNITGRANWNYVKTVDCYVRADIPQDDVIEIQSMFNNGVTFWHNASTFGDYSQSNTITS